MSKIAFKVLVAGESCSGGDFKWSLPKKNSKGRYTPGKWHSIDAKPVLCVTGFHLTNDPAFWWKEGAIVYIAEYAGRKAGNPTDNKFSVEKVRLLRPATELELRRKRIFTSGKHTVNSCRSGAQIYIVTNDAELTLKGIPHSTYAYDKATVRCNMGYVAAHNKSKVYLSGSASALADDKAKIYSSGMNTITLGDDTRAVATRGARITASGTARAVVSGKCRVFLYDRSRALGMGNSKILINGSHSDQKVSAYGKTKVFKNNLSKATVELFDSATVA